MPCSLQFYTYAITLAEVLCQSLAKLIYFSRQHQLVVVVHPVQICSCRENLALVLIAKLQVTQTFCLCMGIFSVRILHLLDEVIAYRLLVDDAIRNIHSVVAGYVIVQTKLWIEEVVVVIDNITSIEVHTIHHTWVLQLIVHMTILQIHIGIQVPQQSIVHLAIYIKVSLS